MQNQATCRPVFAPGPNPMTREEIPILLERQAHRKTSGYSPSAMTKGLGGKCPSRPGCVGPLNRKISTRSKDGGRATPKLKTWKPSKDAAYRRLFMIELQA
ncbi:hypothetical protein HYDPIDRAFT_115130 [Hydnomerulius pinastri MD-312]|uniref:Uncharacterized protein n=1 Tax=Hydnomerulius pinastri MD-312 TaxID=994086 RepID=A0A0C9V8G4_9AGAM|nr:hypothetical protein HYDPIDRAFT_115130 [Hydnomerulius pinastri MD-312]